MTEVLADDIQDITPEVLRFFNRDLERGEEHSVVIPDLRVIAVNGIIQASRHIQTFDGCHPYEYDTRDEAKSFAVTRLGVKNRGWGPRGPIIDTEKGQIPAGEADLESYRFVRPRAVERQANEEEHALAERLASTPFLAAQSAEQLVGYDHQLLASAVEPLEHPISIPIRGEYGHAEPVQHTPIASVSMYEDTAGQKQVILTIGNRAGFGSPGRQLLPVPLEHVRFEVQPQPDERRAVFRRALALNELGFGAESIELTRLVGLFNELNSGDSAMGLIMDKEYPNEHGICAGMVGSLENGRIVNIQPPDRSDLITLYSPDTLLIEPHSQQLYIADETAGKVLSAQHVFMKSRQSAEEAMRWRMY